jgi:cell shape-determining protein MreC
LASSLNARFADAPTVPKSADGKVLSPAELAAEVQRQRVVISSLSAQLDELRKRDAFQDSLGPELRNFCRVVQVWGNDAGVRQTLSLQGSTFDGLGNGMPVISTLGVVGRIELAGIGAARVRLITDANFTIAAEFRRFEPAETDGGNGSSKRVDTPAFTVTGDGHGRMTITNLRTAEVNQAGLKAGDWVTLADHDGWPMLLQGRKIGEVESIREQKRLPLFADIIVKPDEDLMKLREVMVVVKK